MSRRISYIVHLNLILLFTHPVFAFDTLKLQINDLNFTSHFEKRYFIETCLNETSSFFATFASLEESDSTQILGWQSIFQKFLQDAYQIKKGKSNEKYLKQIYKLVHDRFLIKYVEKSNFEMIFQNGNYNCVTAVALYAMVFDYLKIPYVIKETPAHVFIITYPANEQILIETTDPVDGFKTFSAGFKETFVQNLGMHKLIDQNELILPVKQIFDKYYFNSATIGLKELAGIHYHNATLFAYEQNNKEEALYRAFKAHKLRENKQSQDILFSLLVEVLAKEGYSKPINGKYLGLLIQIKDTYNVTNNDIIAEFGRIVYQNITSSNDTTNMKLVYQQVIPYLSDTILKDELDYLYFHDLSVVYFNRGYFTESLEWSEKAYNIKPKNLEVEKLFTDALLMDLRNHEAEKALIILDRMLAQHKDLLSNRRIGEVWLNLMLFKMGDEFEKNNIKKANEYLAMFENTSNSHPNIKYDVNEAGWAFSRGVVYYFKRNQLNNARLFAERGLKYSPRNIELINRRNALRK